MFYLFISSTKLATVPGLSAAGANVDVVQLTAPADADIIHFGKPKVMDAFPLDPAGHPTPAIITRAAVLEGNLPCSVVRAGTVLPPTAPYVDTGALPGGDPRSGKAVPTAEVVFEAMRTFARSQRNLPDGVFLGESIPGGTTTALLVLRALGYAGMVSSGGVDNPTSLKEKIWNETCDRLGDSYLAEIKNNPLAAVSEVGDPMQAAVLGFMAGLPAGIDVTLAGGTQMLAVAALARRMSLDTPLCVATTKYVVNDKSSNFAEIAESIGVKTWGAPLDFSSSPYAGLADYEKGFVKEGAGAGGAVKYALKKGASIERIIEKTNELYSQII